MNSLETNLWRQRRLRVGLVAVGLLTQLVAVRTLSAEVGNGMQALPPVGSGTTADKPVAAAAHYNHYLADAADGASDDASDDATGDATETDDEQDFLARLEALEESHEALQEDYGKLSDSYGDLKKKMKSVASTGHSEATMKVNGRLHVDMWSFPESSPGVNFMENENTLISPQDRLGFRRMRFGVKGSLPANMEYKIEMEFAGGNNSEFRDAYLGVNDLPFMQTVLLGNQKRPYGLDHLNSSRFNVFLERPFVIEGFNQDSRRWGVCSYNVSEDQAWNWRYGAYNLDLMQATGNYVSDHYQMEVAGRLANTFWYDESSDGRGYGHWAISGTAADPDGNASVIPGRAPNEGQFRTRPEARSSSRWLDTGQILGADNYQLLGLENVWNFGPVQLTGEYQNVWLQRDSNTEVHLHGGYAYISYFLTGEYMPWDRQSGTLDRIYPLENFFLVDTCCDGVRGGWGAWQVAYRYSYANFNDQDILGGVGNSHTLGLNWYWNPYARMQFNAIYGEIDDRNVLDDADDPTSSLGVYSGHYTTLGARFMVDF